VKQASIKEDATGEIRALLNRLKDSDWWVRKETIRKLLDYPEALYVSDLKEWLRNGEDALLRNASMETFRELGERALASLAFLLMDEDVDVRIFAANVIGDIKDPAALGALAGALHDPVDNVRIAAAEALGKIGDNRAVGPLTEALGDMPWAALAAIEALGKIGGNDALYALYTCLENEDYQAMACAAIGQAGDRSSLDHLAAYLDHEDIKALVLQAIVCITEREERQQ
jgi:HEAT repeat protein